MYRYFVTIPSENDGQEQEVSLERYCQVERRAGFRPKLPSTHPNYMTTPATGGFSAGGLGVAESLSGRTVYVEEAEQ